MNNIKKLLIAVFAVPAILTAVPAMAQSATYTITASSDTTGTISPSGSVTVNSGASQTFIITPGQGVDIEPITIDVTGQATPIPTATANVFRYTFKNVNSNHSIDATFYPSDPADGATQITGQPQSLTVVPGATATFTVTADQTSSLSYQWYKSTNSGSSFSIVYGANGPSYTTPATSLSDNGTEFVCEVYNDFAYLSTNAVTLTVFSAPANPYVKVQGRQLVADFTGTGTNYQPYVIRGVDYSPVPIGRYSSDWGYFISQNNVNPAYLPNNMLADDTNILDRDFSELQLMNANTIRIWGGDNTLETASNQPVSQTTFENVFPLQAPSYGDDIYNWLLQNNYVNGEGYINVDLTSSTILSALQAEFQDPNESIVNGEYYTILDVLRKAYYGSANPGRFPNMITPATLDAANNNGLKVIAGFWVGPFGSCNYTTTPCTYALNTYNAESNDPGLKVPFDLTNPYIANDILMRFEVYVNTFKNSPEILFWAIGNENNYSFDPNNPDSNFNTTAQMKAWYNLVNQMAAAAHAIEGATYHPVAVVNGDIEFIGNSNYAADDHSLPNVDIWGANTYHGQSFNDYFIQYKALSSKPFWISEYGIDAWKSCNTADPLTPNCDPNDPSGTEPVSSVLPTQKANDEADQAAWDGGLWNEIAGNGDVTIGGTVMEYSDEWWKPYDWICTSLPYSNYGDAAICQSNHFYFGEGPNSNWPPPSFLNPHSPNPPEPNPGNYDNESWYGLMAITNSSPEMQADTMTPRQAYTALQGDFLNSINNVPLASYLVSPVKGTTLSSSSITFKWSLGRGVSQYQLLVGTTLGGSDVYSNTQTATSATVTGIPLIGQTLYVQLGSYTNGYWQYNRYTYSTILVTYSVTVDSNYFAGGGSTYPASGTYSGIPEGTTQTIDFVVNQGYYMILTDNGTIETPTPPTFLNPNYTYTFKVNQNHTISALFIHNPDAITYNTTEGSGSGSITCYLNGSPCPASVPYGSNMFFTATPGTGSTFGSWADSCVGGIIQTNPYNTCYLHVTSNIKVTAKFTATSPQFKLNLTGPGTATFTILGSNLLNCKITAGTQTGTCAAAVPMGKPLELQVGMPLGETVDWGGACQPATNTNEALCSYTPTVSSSVLNINVTPFFPVTISSPNYIGRGTISPAPGTFNVNDGVSQTISIGVYYGYYFGLTDNGKTITPAPPTYYDPYYTYTFNVTGPHNIGVVFLNNPDTITYKTTGGSGTGSITCYLNGSQCPASVPYGSNMFFTATAGTGSTFASWGGACTNGIIQTSPYNTCYLHVTSNISVSAKFNS